MSSFVLKSPRYLFKPLKRRGKWNIKNKVRIAQTNLTCAECGGVIKIGHPYVWRERQVGSIIHLERVHPKCGENKGG